MPLAFATLLQLRPDITAVSFLAAAIGFLSLSVPFILLSMFIMRFYHIARHVKPGGPIPALLKDMRNF